MTELLEEARQVQQLVLIAAQSDLKKVLRTLGRNPERQVPSPIFPPYAADRALRSGVAGRLR